MLSDDEHHALHEIERRLRWESPELVRLFNGGEPQVPANAPQRAGARALLAAAAINVCALLGPRMLTEAEVRSRQRAPLPRIEVFDTAIARRTNPVSRPIAPTALLGVGEVLMAPSTVGATPRCRAA